MGKGVNIPLTISGLREARENLEKLNEEIDKTQDVKKSQKLVKQYNDLSKAIDETTDSLIEANKAGELVGTKFDDLNEVLFQTNEEVLPLTSQIGEMEDRMYQLAAAGDTSSKEFKALQGETVRLRKVIIETDRSIDTMAENAGSIGGITSAFGELGESVLNLDFKRAGVALKGLGTQFKAFGATLLANPIFLIVAVVAAIVTAVVTLKDKIKVLGDIFDFFAGIVNDAVQALKDFLDWVGLTNFAEQDLAAQRAETAKEYLALLDKQSSAYQSDIDRKIALAQAEGKNVTELEIQKQKEIAKTSLERIKAIAVLAKQEQLAGTLTLERAKELQKAQQEAIQARKDAQNQIKVIEATETKERRERAKTRKEDKDKELAEDLARAEELRKAQEEIDKAKIEREDAQYKLLQELRSTDQENEIAALVEQYESKFDLAEGNAELEKALAIQQAEDIAAINKKYADEKIAQDAAIFQNVLDLQAKEKQEAIAAQQAKIAAVEDYATQSVNALSSINNLANVIGENRLKKVKEGSKAEEKIRKQMFVRQKALNLAMAAIDGFKAITASLAQAPIAIGPVPNPAGIASLAFATASTAASIAAIAAQRFEGGGSKPSASTPSLGGVGGGGATSSAPSTPSFELFGQPNEGNNVSSPEAQETQMTVKAVVVESDITNTQNKVAKMQKNAEL